MTEGQAFRDLFSRDSPNYAKFRPRYPAELFSWVAGLPAARRLAWDAATGNGQAAVMLAPHFERVIGSDGSRAQVKAADRGDNVRYLAALADASGLAEGRVDLVTVAQAFHWFDRPRFFAEVERIAAPGAALAIWGYARLQAGSPIDAVLEEFYEGTVGPYWPPERKEVEREYAGIDIPIIEVAPPALAIQARLSFAEFIGYVRTWSAVGRYMAANGHDPVDAFAPSLAAVWGDLETRRPIRWPLFIRAGRWRRG